MSWPQLKTLKPETNISNPLVLPGLFKDMHPPAATSDIAGIIQWKLFGDKDHTGNGTQLPSSNRTFMIILNT